jgi:hypothetical protein
MHFSLSGWRSPRLPRSRPQCSSRLRCCWYRQWSSSSQPHESITPQQSTVMTTTPERRGHRSVEVAVNRRSLLSLFLAVSVSACTALTQPSPTTTATGSVSGLLPIDPPLEASRPVLPAMPADCHSSPDLAPTWRAPQASTVPIATVLERARQDSGGGSRAGRWFEKAPTDLTLVTLRDGRAMWMIGYADPPPFPLFGPGPGFGMRSRWTAWIALFDAKTGDFVTAFTCGRVPTLTN